MPAYVLAVGETSDPTKLDAYRQAARQSVIRSGGRWVARGTVVEVLEGAVGPTEAVVLEFETEDAARKWFHSPEYRAAKELRAGASKDLLSLLLASTALPAAASA